MANKPVWTNVAQVTVMNPCAGALTCFPAAAPHDPEWSEWEDRASLLACAHHEIQYPLRAQVEALSRLFDTVKHVTAAQKELIVAAEQEETAAALARDGTGFVPRKHQGFGYQYTQPESEFEPWEKRARALAAATDGRDFNETDRDLYDDFEGMADSIDQQQRVEPGQKDAIIQAEARLTAQRLLDLR